MKNKIVGIFVCMLLIATVFPIVTSTADEKSNNMVNDGKSMIGMLSYIPYNLPHDELVLKQNQAYREFPLDRGWYYLPSHTNYAPNGTPDFSQKQGEWKSIFDGGNGIAESTAVGDDVQVTPVGEPVDPDLPAVVAPGSNCALESTPAGDDYSLWMFCTAVSPANCFWWLDSKYSDPDGTPGDGEDEFPLVEDYGAGDDHAVDNAPLLIKKMANALNITNTVYLFPEVWIETIDNWFVDTGLEDMFEVSGWGFPTFEFIAAEIEQSKSVFITFVFFNQIGDECVIVGSHVVACAGVNIDDYKIAISDPFWDIQNPPGNPEEHNDPQYVSHDIYDVVIGSPCLNYPEIEWWLPGYNPYVDYSIVYYAVVIDATIEADLYAYGDLSWNKVKPGSTVTDTFEVKNEGDPYSMLDWEVTEWPDWGDWTFTPSSGENLRPEDNDITVEVEVVAPDENKETFTGEVKVVNLEDPHDFEIIDVSLTTPKNKAFNINLLFLRFLENHPRMFPILRNMLGL